MISCRQTFLHTLLWACLLLMQGLASADEVIHRGPVLDIQIQRGNESLPLFQVPHLRKGDLLRVMPEPSSLAKGDWVLLLALISPSGNQVDTQGFDLAEIKSPLTLEIKNDEQIPVIVLAPQVRNLFGLYTSFSESADLLKQALLSDPQRFYDLQKLDQINQAITALSQGLDQMVLNQSSEQSIAAAKTLAIQFGVRNIDPECFKNNMVNTQCVAANIVSNKDFVLPSSSELGMVLGQKKAADLTSFLTANVRVFSEAGDFLTHKFRDQYDFAPTFGRRKGDSGKTELYSLARFKNGSIKTAYVYVPAWFNGKMPSLWVKDATPPCLPSGRFEVEVSGRLPIMNYWHGWEMRLMHPQTHDMLAQQKNIVFLPERGVFQISEVPPVSGELSEVAASLSGKFGFENVDVPMFRMALPLQGDWPKMLRGVDRLISGEVTEIALAAGMSTACVQKMALERLGVTLAQSKGDRPLQLPLDLRRTSKGEAFLWVFQNGSEPLSLPLQILPERAQVSRVTHAELDTHISVTGEQLERIASVEVGELKCLPQSMQEDREQTHLTLNCPAGIRLNANLPNEVTVHHQGGEPASFQVRLQKAAAVPRVQVVRSAQAALVRPSAKALQWGLLPQEGYISDDSGLSLLLEATEGYSLARGQYALELRFVDDPATTSTPLKYPLMVDFIKQELRTRAPISFQGVELPSVVNPLEFRVRHEATGLVGAWLALGRAVLLLPDFRKLTCASPAGRLWLHGTQLDLIDSAVWASVSAEPGLSTAGNPFLNLVPCADGLCLELSMPAKPSKLSVSLRWVPQRIFGVDLGELPICSAP